MSSRGLDVVVNGQDLLALVRLARIGKRFEQVAERSAAEKRPHAIISLLSPPDISLEALERLQQAMLSGERVSVLVGSAARIVDTVHAKFASGNSVPVERITLRREEVGL